MIPALDIIEAAMESCERARARVRRGRSKQVQSVEEIDYIKSVAYAWFHTHRAGLDGRVSIEAIKAADAAFRSILDATVRACARSTYTARFADAKDALVEVRASALVPTLAKGALDAAPDFSPLAQDAEMQRILAGRWSECQACITAGANLAATVMMGGLLEALFVARANKMTDKRPLFQAKATPIDGRTKKPLQLGEWTLRPYIEVAAELGWITRPGKDVASVLRDYRNYVHPEKERVHGVSLNAHDSAMFWELTKSLARQLLAS